MADGVVKNGTAGELREREGDYLYAFVLLFTYGQLILILWDMFAMVKGFGEIAGVFGVGDPGKIHSFGEMTTMYLGLIGAYIGRNAWQKYKNAADTDEVPRYLFLKVQRGYFYTALWVTLCFTAYMLKGFDLIQRLPYELTVTAIGVFGLLVGDKTIKHYLDKRTVSLLGAADAESNAANHKDTVMAQVAKNGRVTNRECQEITGLSPAQVTRVLEELEREGKLKQKGDGRGVYYEKA
jgi:DNA-binding transcriptional ArsR family regulator/uncharacterized membrane protein YeaQ/YmgE (transglycosylase-associated protein family)